MSGFTVHDLQCFDAVVREGGFQAAATALNRSHPAVFAAVAKLEKQLGLILFDRSGYRIGLTAQGRAFHARAQSLLQEWARLGVHARQLAMGEESELRVVIGDLCPLPETLALLSRFFARCPGTRLSLHFETVGGPLERLFDDQVDLILHRVEKSDTRLEWIDLGTVPMLPVLAPGLLVLVNDGHDVRPEQLRELTQCVLRDSARHSAPQNYFIVPGARQCTVPDQLMKKELILQGMAWGHLPAFLIGRELREGRLKSVAGQHFPGRVEELVAARRRDRPHGPVASRLWDYIRAQAPGLRSVVKAGAARKRGAVQRRAGGR
jgi:DNA-binding transcriptional LysR family regulator